MSWRSASAPYPGWTNSAAARNLPSSARISATVKFWWSEGLQAYPFRAQASSTTTASTRLGSHTATRSPGRTPAACSAAATASTHASNWR